MQDVQHQINMGWPLEAIEFFQLYARMEGELKQAGYTKKGRKLAEADWNPFAASLGMDFFQFVRDSKMANTLIRSGPPMATSSFSSD